MSQAPANLAECLSDPRRFRQSLFIFAGGQRVPLKCDPRQEREFAAVDEAAKRVAGRGGKRGCIHQAWNEKPRGSSKTQDTMIIVLYVLLAATRAIRCVGAAVDRDMARLMLVAAARLIEANPWLGERLEVTRDTIINRVTGATFEAISADEKSSWGHLIDNLAIDKLTVWPNDALWSSLISAAGKQEHCLVLCQMNAGWFDAWTWPIRESVRQDPANWAFSSWNSPAPWISEATLAQQRRLLHHSVYDRVWRNVWQLGVNGALEAGLIEAAQRLPGPMPGNDGDHVFYGGLDVGTVSDHTAFTVVGRNSAGRVRLASVMSWVPPKRFGGWLTGTIDLDAVESAIAEAHDRFGLFKVFFDPSQAVNMAQRLSARGVPMEPVHGSAANHMAMATLVLEMFSSGTVDLYPDDGLVKDLQRLQFVDRGATWRLSSERTKSGHGDRGWSFIYAAFAASKYPMLAWGAGSIGTARTVKEGRSSILDAPRGLFAEHGPAFGSIDFYDGPSMNPPNGRTLFEGRR